MVGLVVVGLAVTVRGVVPEGEEDHAHLEVGVVDLEVARGNMKEEVAVIEGMTRGNGFKCASMKCACVYILLLFLPPLFSLSLSLSLSLSPAL